MGAGSDSRAIVDRPHCGGKALMARFHGRLREIPNVLKGFGRKKALAEEAGLSALQTKAIVRKTLDAIVSTLITDLRSDAAIRGFRDQDTGVPRRARPANRREGFRRRKPHGGVQSKRRDGIPHTIGF